VKGVALKATYNDGGSSSGLIGYRGVCSDRMIAHNVLGKPVTWCSQKQNECAKYARSGFNTPRPRLNHDGSGPCYESSLLSMKPFRFGAGVYHNGDRAGEPIPIQGVTPGDVAFLTTRLPDQPEEARIVFGCFRIGAVRSDDQWGNVIDSDGTMDVVLPDHVAQSLHYWNYQDVNADGSRKWATGLFRYMSEEAARRLIQDLLARLDSLDERDTILKATGLPPSRLQGGGLGGLGEGQAHRELKMRVASDPTLIGLPRESVARIESVFATGDRVDIRFELPDRTTAVVEIETFYTLVGAHQAVKYRALAQVERGEPFGSGGVHAFVVAYEFDEETRRLASQYAIRLVALSPPSQAPSTGRR
jgi:hypothetical protein